MYNFIQWRNRKRHIERTRNDTGKYEADANLEKDFNQISWSIDIKASQDPEVSSSRSSDHIDNVGLKGKRKRDHDTDSTSCRRSSRLSKKQMNSKEIKKIPNIGNKKLQDRQADDDTLDKDEIDNLLSREGKMSPTFIKECRKICKVIKSKSKHILNVETAHNIDAEEIVLFLVISENEIEIKTKWDERIIIRPINRYTGESRDALYCKANRPLTEQESRKLERVIDRHSTKLMSKYKLLSSVSASSVTSKHYGKGDAEIKVEPCIVLNVLVKGIILSNEEPFPRKLDNVPVDVREAGVLLYDGSAATDYQPHLTMGCKITSSCGKNGTLGGFIEHPEYGLCGTTCAHVVLNDYWKQKLKGKSKVQKNDLDTIIIFQPYNTDGNEIGKVVEVIYKEGENDRPGIDLALFKIDKRAPTNGEFPKNQQQSALKPFKTGLVWGKTGIPTDVNIVVQKFGFVTGHTYGTIQFTGSVIKEIEFNSKLQVEENNILTTTLFKQYQIISSDPSIPFCKPGDSGALVFMEDSSGEGPELRCIGMVVGGNEKDNTCYVTPITSVLDELEVKQLKTFTNNSIDNIDRRLDRIETSLNELKSAIENITNPPKEHT